ncbi:MAG: PQQ-binding-like beta-propeller repeat protein [Candidatus Acidiferrales bacterium]
MPLFARERIVIQAGLNGNQQLRAADATLERANPSNKDGSLPTLTVSTSRANANERALVEFDLSPLTNVGVKQATMTLNVVTPFTGNKARTYAAHAVTSFFHESDVTWNDRVGSTVAWGSAGGGGDFNGAATATAAVDSTTASISFDITPDVQSWFNGSPNYGEIVLDANEGAGKGNGGTTVFGSKEATLPANAPSLTVTYVQNVTNLQATPGNATISLSWTIPPPLANATVLEPYTGVLILRRAGSPVDKASLPADGNDPGLCATVGSGVVVFDDSSELTNFTDNGACGALANGKTYFYKVFLRDSANNYSSQDSGSLAESTFTEEISAMPNSPASALQKSLWMAASFSNDLAAPSLVPGNVALFGTGSSLLFGIDANTGLRKYPPVSLGGPIDSSSPVIDAADSSLGQNVVYVADNDALAYGINTDTGQIAWVVNPNGVIPDDFVGGEAVQLKSFSSPSYKLARDLVVLGTDNGGTTRGNQIIGLDGNSGAAVWTTTGNANGVSPVDIIVSTPLVDYVNGAIWVTSRSAGGTAQPSLWKLDPDTGKVLFSAKLGDTDSSPSLSLPGDILFVGNNAGTLYAINPITGAILKSFAGGDGAIVGFPVVIGFSSPYTVVFSGVTSVHAVTFNKTTGAFTQLWTPVTIDTPSAPTGATNLGKVYVGANDGKIHEIDLATGKDDFDVTANLLNGLNNAPAIVGNPSIDLLLSRVYITTNDQRAYAFPFPF